MNVLIFPKEALKYFFITLDFRLNLKLLFKGIHSLGMLADRTGVLLQPPKGASFCTNITVWHYLGRDEIVEPRSRNLIKRVWSCDCVFLLGQCTPFTYVRTVNFSLLRGVISCESSIQADWLVACRQAVLKYWCGKLDTLLRQLINIAIIEHIAFCCMCMSWYVKLSGVLCFDFFVHKTISPTAN